MQNIKKPCREPYISRERDPQSGASGGATGTGRAGTTFDYQYCRTQENGVAIGAFGFESGNFLRI